MQARGTLAVGGQEGGRSSEAEGRVAVGVGQALEPEPGMTTWAWNSAKKLEPFSIIALSSSTKLLHCPLIILSSAVPLMNLVNINPREH